MRRYGYEKGGMVIREDEAAIVREVFDRFLKGDGPLPLARDLNSRGIKTVAGKMWTANAIRTLLDSNHVAGIRIHQGKAIGDGAWPAIIDRGTFEEAQARRAYRAARQAAVQAEAPRRFYLLRGLITCDRCGTLMSGSRLGGVPSYMCTRASHADERKCVRKIRAVPVEEFVTDAAINLLEKLTVDGSLATTTVTEATAAEIDADTKQLAELNEMWTAREISTPEYRKMRKAIEDRLAKAQRKTVLRPLKVLEGITGPNTRAVWHDPETTDERRNAALHFLFAAVRIGPSTTTPGIFDLDRISVEQNPLS